MANAEVTTELDDAFNEYICVVRSKLNAERIKLWLQPFTKDDGSRGEFPLVLVSRFVKDLGIEEDVMNKVLEYLRHHAVEKLNSRQEYQSKGIATLKINAQWMNADGERVKRNFTIQMNLKQNVFQLHERLKQDYPESNYDYETLKIIHKGQLLKPDVSLESQNVVNSSHLMVIFKLKECDVNKESQVSERLQETKKIAEALADRKGGGKGKHDHYFLEINDQKGNKIELPEQERKSLSLAMTLHEKGRVLLKQENYLESLLLLLEADHEFSNCRSELLNAVDNYGILCLDIVWCYFKLHKLDYLPDAEEKLLKCKDCLSRSYGPNLERLTLVKEEESKKVLCIKTLTSEFRVFNILANCDVHQEKGTSQDVDVKNQGSELNELSLFVRVHILEAICNYLRGNFKNANKALNKAEEHLRRLQIDDEKFTQLISMGFSPTEARLSLRACRNDVTMCVEFISRRKEELRLRKEREQKEKNDRKIARKYGNTTSGNVINLDTLKNLEEMGFSHQLAVAALKQSDNDMNQALEALQNNPELLIMSIGNDVVPEHLIHQFVAIGFDVELVKKTLRQCKNNVNECMNILLKYQQDHGASTSSALSENDTSVSTASAGTSDVGDRDEEKEDNELDQQVADTLQQDLQQTTDDEYLDLTLDEETQLVNKYRLLLASVADI